MKQFLIIYLCYIMNVNSIESNRKFYPNLPIGKFQIKFKGVLNCLPIRNYYFQHNIYLSKTSSTGSELKGNITIIKPFDDTLDIDINMAVKDSIGGWKDNAFLYKAPKACSTLKYLMGNAWTQVVTGFGIKNATCPFVPGIYNVKGLDTSIFQKSNFPKEFFYGTYKFRLIYSKHNEMYGCVIYIIDLIRPWE